MMEPVTRLHMEVCRVLCDVETHGIKIDIDKLSVIEKEFKEEYKQLEVDLNRIVKNLCGDTPINLSSAEDRSKFFYSVVVKNKKAWKNIFDLGTELRDGKRKKKFVRTTTTRNFIMRYRPNVKPFMKTQQHNCGNCGGRGIVEYVRKDGTYGIPRKCKQCFGRGSIYHETNEVAGLGLRPENERDLSVHGFKTDVNTIKSKLLQVKGVNREFLEKYMRYNALSTYLNTFIENIKNNTNHYGYIHPQFMQCITATGRFSSRNPNFQNMPRSGTFPVRAAIVSRFEGGKILEGDYSQLEFRVAAFLSQDEQAKQDVLDKVDVHSYTAQIIGVSRQDAKAHTFKPLYGGKTGTEAERRYYTAFLEKYSGVAKWQQDLCNEALVRKKVVLPSTREYMFPNVRKYPGGGYSNSTQIKNYPVQGFATADLLPIALVSLHKKIKKAGIKSLICNTVHDSIVMDVHPDEEEICIELMKEAMLSLKEECKSRFGIDYNVPVGIELKIGCNWSDLKEVCKEERN